jgi:hypothetical protein
MSAPDIIECRVIDRKIVLGDGKLYACSEIFMTDERGQHYCSRTWESLTDDPFQRAYQIAQFKQRWEANERRYPDG